VALSGCSRPLEHECSSRTDRRRLVGLHHLPPCRSPSPARLRGFHRSARRHHSCRTSTGASHLASPSRRLESSGNPKAPPPMRFANTPPPFDLRPFTPGARRLHRIEAATPPMSRSAHAVLLRYDGLLRCAGSTRIAAWCRTWGSLRWVSARAWELPPSARGGPTRSAFTPFEGLILSDSRSASLRPLPPCRSPLPARLRGVAPSTSPSAIPPLPVMSTPDPSLGSAPLRGHDFIAGGHGLP
jgi:hypothetical protein